MRLLLVAILVALVGCEVKTAEPTQTIDQCIRAELFKQCLAIVPKGPVSTVENPWHKVVDECDGASTRQSYRLSNTVKPECRSH